MSLSWKRPTDIKFPSIWFEFEATDVDGCTIVKYRVQDLPPNRYEEVLHFMTTDHFTEEALWLAKGKQFRVTSIKGFNYIPFDSRCVIR